MKKILLLLAIAFYSTFTLFGVDRELFREAEARFRNQNYVTALDLYERFITEEQISPDIPDAWFKKAVCLYQLGRFNDSLTAFNKVAQSYPSTNYIELVPFWKGRILFNRKEYNNAVNNFTKYIREAVSTVVPEAYLFRAICLQELDKIEDSIFSLEILLDLDDYKDDGRIAAMLCSNYLKIKEYQRIIELSDSLEYAEIKTEYVDRIKLYKAEAFYRQEDYSAATGIYFDLANDGGTVSGPAWQRLFTIYHKEDKMNELTFLLADAENSLKSDRKILADFRMRIGVASYNAKEYKMAEKYLLSVWDTSSPEEMSAIAPLYYSKILERNGNTKRAIDILEVFFSNSSDMQEEILIRLAELYIKNGEYIKADERLNIFFEMFTNSKLNSEAAYLKAFVCFKKEDYKEALDYSSMAYTSDKGGSRNASLLRLESSIYKKMEDYTKSADKLLRYIDYQPNDVRSTLELLKVNFLLKKYDKVLADSIKLKQTSGLKENSPYSYLISSYLAGLSAIALSDYNSAIKELTPLTPENSNKAGLNKIYPYALYYKGWAFYKMSDYKAASLLFNELITKYPASVPAPEAAYLAGWCEYISGNYDKSSSFFVRYSSLAGNEESGRFMYAKSLVELGRYAEAAEIFAEIPRNNADSTLADDALFEKASLNATLGNTSQAISDYEYLYKRYGGKLAEEGMFRRAELFYSTEDYKTAVTAFYEFRINFPNSNLFDAALYWGGMAQLKNEEDFGAALLWESLIDNYKDSVFRAEAMLKTASVYQNSGDYQEALKLYEKCRLEYAGTEKATTASFEAEKIRYIMSGLSEKEAELNAVITKEGGSATKKGRQAMVKLASLYISMGEDDLKPALSMLEEIVSKKKKDPETAADAQYYIAENYYRHNKYSEAVKAFVEAAGIYPENKDSSARALYRATHTAIIAESKGDAENIVQQLKDYYPGSAWAIEAEKLLQEGN